MTLINKMVGQQLLILRTSKDTDVLFIYTNRITEFLRFLFNLQTRKMND